MPIGIVAEYNPFHNGHKYQLETAKELAKDDCVIVAMSGNFVQRADAAICDKWARAKMALSCGADLVVEIPSAMALSSAEFFASGAISLLHLLKVNHISFGTECDDLSMLQSVANILIDQPQWYKDVLKDGLDKGLSFPAARSAALPEYKEILSSPNNILAIEYLKAGAISPIVVPRKSVGHDSTEISSDGFASASAVREHISSGNFEQAKKLMPKEAFDILMHEIEIGRAPTFIESLDKAIIAKLRVVSADELRKIADVSEGIENRILKTAKEHTTIKELANHVKTKRYTHSRIRRIIINAYLELEQTTRPYIRLLGSTARGRMHLKESACENVITKVAHADFEQIKNDIRATDIFSLLYPNTAHCAAGQDFTRSPIVL